MRHIALALGFVLVGAADWQLVARDGDRVAETMCAKSAESCEAAARLIRNPVPDLPAGMPPFAPELRGLELACVPARQPCFTKRSNCIVGHNCPPGVR